MRSVAVAACVLLASCASPALTPDVSPASSASHASASPPSSASPSATEPLPSSAEPAAAPAWIALAATGPTPREDHTWTVDEAAGVAYLFGGRDGAAVSAELWAYDLATDAWEQVAVPGGPAARFGHDAVWVDEVGVVVFGGQAGATFFNDLWAYDPAGESWSELPARGDVPVARYGSCAAIGPEGRLWISHGFTSEQARFNDTLSYDFATGTWTDETPEDPLPINRCLHGCWWTETGELALFGGQTTGTVALGDLWLLADGVWTRVEGALPVARNLYARVRLDSATVGFGGQALDETYLADAFLLPDGEADALALEPSGPAPAPRAAAAMILDSERGRILMFGGRDAERAYDDVWELRNVAGS